MKEEVLLFVAGQDNSLAFSYDKKAAAFKMLGQVRPLDFEKSGLRCHGAVRLT